MQVKNTWKMSKLTLMLSLKKKKNTNLKGISGLSKAQHIKISENHLM